MSTVRQTKSGSFELRITHRALNKPYYSTHDTEELARAYAGRLVALLDRGEVPPELRAAPAAAAKPVPLRAALGEYLARAPIAPSDRPMVQWLTANLHGNVTDVTVLWVEQWVRSMKEVEQLAPGTIRKRVESLARALDWWNLREHRAGAVPANPLRLLKRGYSAYDGAAPARVDRRRDRRLHPGEEERIEAALQGARRPDRQRPLSMPHREALTLLWRLLVNTGLRLREAYRLRWRDLRFDLRTIHVPRSKTGRARDVPMTPAVHSWLLFTQREHVCKSGHDPSSFADELVFPFWDGEESSLNRTTSRLSRAFARLFEYAGCGDLTEHDLRHEATCRWMLMRDGEGRWLFRPEEVRRITGHLSVQMFERYLSLRGSDLAERLW